jgi:hypothetical protein
MKLFACPSCQQPLHLGSSQCTTCGTKKVLIGHEEGLITINIAEADAPFREKIKKAA